MSRILLIASRKTTVDSLRELIEERHFDCSVASNQRSALYLVRRQPPDVVIVDYTSTRLSGAKLCSVLRRLSDVPLIAIVRERQEAAAMQATDCLVKPYTDQQLLSCIRRVLRWYPRELVAGALRLDLRTRRVFAPHLPGGTRLRPKLFALLALLMRHRGEVVSRATLMREVWHTDFIEDTRTLDVHIHWVREIIEPHPTQPIYLRTMRGEGYCINCQGEAPPADDDG